MDPNTMSRRYYNIYNSRNYVDTNIFYSFGYINSKY